MEIFISIRRKKKLYKSDFLKGVEAQKSYKTYANISTKIKSLSKKHAFTEINFEFEERYARILDYNKDTDPSKITYKRS